MEKKTVNILMAFDGSALALEAVRYVAEIMPADQTRVVLFYVKTDVQRSFWQMEKEMDFRYQAVNLRSQMATQHQHINTAFEKARSILLAAGFAKEFIQKKIQVKNLGVVNDIIREAQTGYDAIALGRTSGGKLKEMLLGAMTAKLIKKIQGMPVIIVDGTTHKNRVLVAFDGSREVMRAIQSLSFLMGAPDCKVCLCHVLKPLPDSEEMDELHWQEVQVKQMEPLVSKSKQALFDAGFAFNQISCEMVKQGSSRASSILKKAKEERYGTVVIGRRGLNVLGDIFFGRVGEKIFQQAKDITVWVLG